MTESYNQEKEGLQENRCKNNENERKNVIVSELEIKHENPVNVKNTIESIIDKQRELKIQVKKYAIIELEKEQDKIAIIQRT
ncbi:hypothetical protein FQA39_LY05434 [Lamprigera yunnana]|nr:hypothetical protein FQA39_LY05434 [Lamprigera yunnana]